MEEELINVEIGVSKIKTLAFNIFENIEPVPGEVLLGYGVNFAWNANEDWYEIAINYGFTRSSDNVPILNGTVSTKFVVKDLKKYLINEEKVVLPDSVLVTLFGMAFTHMRALVAQSTAGTTCSWLIIPVVNPTELLKSLFNMFTEHLEKTAADVKKNKKGGARPPK